jgi:GxxExxY protein
MYKKVRIGINYLDFHIDDKLVLEIKSTNAVNIVHLFQTLKYLGYTKLGVGFLVNFGREKMEYKRILPTRKMLKCRQRNANHSNNSSEGAESV